MNNLTNPSVALSAFATRSRLLSLFTFLVLALMLVNHADARTRLTRTSGGIDPSDMFEHNIRVLCTWPDFEGVWKSDPGDSSGIMSVSHSVGVAKDDITGEDVYTGEYATCSGWSLDPATGDFVTEHIPNPDGPTNHEDAPLGYGKFVYKIEYSSSLYTECIEDHDKGIGNNCEKFDKNNKIHNGGGSTSYPSEGGTLACLDEGVGGIKLTYQFYCAEGVAVDGYLTLAPEIDGLPQFASTSVSGFPVFTQCGIERIDAGKCTVRYGGVPIEQVKVKGKYEWAVDTATCLEAFPDAPVNNALGAGITENLAPTAMLLYVEESSTGSCDDVVGLNGIPTAAYGRYCSADIDTFVDNRLTGYDLGFDPSSGDIDGDGIQADGFDNTPKDGFANVEGLTSEERLRICERDTTEVSPHVAFHDVDEFKLVDMYADYQPSFNLNCDTGNGGNDSGVYKVWISDQANVQVSDIVLDDTLKLEGVSHISERASISVDELTGVETLELVYPTCYSLSENIIGNYGLAYDDNNTDVTLKLTGTVVVNSTLFEIPLVVKVNGIPKD